VVAPEEGYKRELIRRPVDKKKRMMVDGGERALVYSGLNR
jgi:hypothetical protein